MTVRWSWIAGGLGVLVLGLVARRTSGRLGKTARQGKRTGAVEVDEQAIDVRTGQLLRQFDRCTNADGVQGLQPLQDGSASPLSSRDAETGEPRLVNVLLRPKPAARDWIPGGGRAVLRPQKGRTSYAHYPVTQEIFVEPNSKKCAPATYWEPFLKTVLIHEMGHVSDPALIRSVFQTSRRRRKDQNADVDYTGYVNLPEETTAQLVEVEHELRQSVREQPWLWKADIEPTQTLTQGSQRYAELAPHLTVHNRRRYQRLAARLVSERQSKWRHQDNDAIFRRMQIDAYRDKYAKR